MARIISGGREGMRAHMYGTMTPDTYDYIQEQIYSYASTFGDQYNRFAETLKNRFNNGAKRQLAIAQSNMEYSGSLFKEGIRTLRTVRDYRTASLNNQRYLLANPYIASEFKQSRIEGWQNKHEDFVYAGDHNPYYQNAIDGMICYGDETLFDEEDHDRFTIYSSDVLDEMESLRMNEQIMVRNNWFRLYNLLNQEGDEVEDPTSIEGSYL